MSQHSAGSSLCGDADEEEWQPEIQCHACLEWSKASLLQTRYMGFHFHQACFAGCRSYARQRTTDDHKKEDKRDIHEKPEVWRSRLQPFLPGGNRVAAIRDAKAKRYERVETKSKVEEKLSLNDDLLLDLTMFTSYHGFWRRWSDERCEQEFWKLNAEQRSVHDEPLPDGNSVARVLVPDIARMRATTGIRSESGVASTVEVPETDFDDFKSAGGAIRQPSPSMYQGGAGSATSAMAPPPPRPRKAEGGYSTPTKVSAAENPKRRLVGKTDGSNARSVKPAEEEDAQSQASSQSAAKRRRTGNSAVDDELKNFEPLEDVKSLKPKQVIERKAKVKRMISNAVQKIVAEKGLLKPVEKVLHKLKKTHPGQDEFDGINAKTLVSDAHVFVKELEGFIDVHQKSTATKLPGVETQIAGKIHELAELEEPLSDALDALTLHSQQAVGEMRKSYLATRFQKSKIQKVLIERFYPAKLAKLFSEHIFDVLRNVEPGSGRTAADWGEVASKNAAAAGHIFDPEAQDVDWSHVMLFSPNHALGKTVLDRRASVQGAEGSIVQELGIAMRDNQKWQGALAQAEAVDSERFPFSSDLKFQDEAGSRPWLVGQKYNFFRWGPSAFPLPGVGCLLQPQLHCLFVAVVNLQKLNEHGVTPADFPKFADTITGASS